MTVDGPYQFRVTSYNESVEFTNVRFDITGGATFSLELAAEEFLGNATFGGITGLVSLLYPLRGDVCSYMMPGICRTRCASERAEQRRGYLM